MKESPKAAPELLPQLYQELRRLAAAKLAEEVQGHTLDATALVHEAYIRLQGSAEFQSPAHFYRSAAIAMQRILVDHARRKKAEKRGGANKRFQINESDRHVTTDPDTLIAMDEALAKLTAVDPGAADIARMRLFTGVSIEEAGANLGISQASAYREWTFAKAFLSYVLQP